VPTPTDFRLTHSPQACFLLVRIFYPACVFFFSFNPPPHPTSFSARRFCSLPLNPFFLLFFSPHFPFPLASPVPKRPKFGVVPHPSTRLCEVGPSAQRFLPESPPTFFFPDKCTSNCLNLFLSILSTFGCQLLQYLKQPTHISPPIWIFWFLIALLKELFHFLYTSQSLWVPWLLKQ